MPEIDALSLLLKQLNLGATKQYIDEIIAMAQNQDWSYREFLQELCERECHQLIIQFYLCDKLIGICFLGPTYKTS
jgi:hypothetical protein